MATSTTWRYETVDLAPDLRAGGNVLAAVAWSFGLHAPMAQVTHETAFWLQGAAPLAATREDVRHHYLLRHYCYVAGPGDQVDVGVWTKLDFNCINDPARSTSCSTPKASRPT